MTKYISHEPRMKKKTAGNFHESRKLITMNAKITVY